MKQAIDIPIGIDLSPFRSNLSYIHSYGEKIMPSLISDKTKAKTFPLNKGLLDDLCAINDVAEFGRSICDIYPKELEPKVKH